MNIWLTFFIASAVIIYAGGRLCILGDVIGKRLRLGQIWVGAFLLALVTSLPEVFASMSAVLFQSAPDLAFGNIFGSVLFNLLLIAVLDFLMGSKLLFGVIGRGLGMTLAIMLAMLSLAMIGLVVGAPYSLGPLGWDSVAIVVAYAIGFKLMFRRDREEDLKERGSTSAQAAHEKVGGAFEGKYADRTLGKAVLLFAFFAALVVVAAIKMTESADAIAEITGLGRTFVGSLFLAFVTSLPEFVVSFHAAREGLYGMAVGNLLGSNSFNIFIIPIVDFCMPHTAVTSQVGSLHVLTLLIGFLMSAIVFMGLRREPKRALGPLGVDSCLLMLVYLAGIYTLFNFRNAV